MQNKKLYIIMGIVIVLVAAAAFVGGRLLTGQAGPLGMLPFGNGGTFSLAVRMKPAPELPTTTADLAGIFVSRDDNTITIQPGEGMGKVVGGGAVTSFSAGSTEGGEPSTSGGPGGSGPKVEVVITKQTKIWRDATEMGDPPSGGSEITVQQKVEEGSLDDLNSDSMVMVWGRKNGDRIIADVISYSRPIVFKKP